MRAFWKFVGPLLPAMACSCSAPPEVKPFGLQATDQVSVVYRESGTNLVLRNKSSLSAEKAYSQVGGNLNLKIASDEDLDALLSGLRSLDFFNVAVGSVHPRARGSLTVRINHQTFVRSRMPGEFSTIADLQQFTNCIALFRHVYDNTLSYHSVPGVSSRDFEATNRRLRDHARTHGRNGK